MTTARLATPALLGVLLLAIGSATLSCGADTAEATAVDLAPETQRAIYEAVFRHQFDHNASAVQQQAPAYFVVIEGEDPSEQFLERFAGHEPPVRPGSAFKIGEGLRFDIDRITATSATDVEVRGGYFESGVSSTRNAYKLELRDDAWQVISDEMLSIS